MAHIHTFRFNLLRQYLGVLVFIVAVPALGQLVTIPDPTFRSFLQTNYPQLMVGDQLDTTHPDLGTITELTLVNVGDLTGIEHFTAIDSLHLTLPASGEQWPQVLPPNIEHLHVHGSLSIMQGPFTINPPSLRSLKLVRCWFAMAGAYVVPTHVKRLTLWECENDVPMALPDDLEYFEVNTATILYTPPTAWPDALDTISIYDNSSSLDWQSLLDTPWPAGLKKLQLQSTQWGGAPLLHLTQPWPEGIKDIDMVAVHLAEMPEFPDGLLRFSYEDWLGGGLTCLPSLPLGLQELIIEPTSLIQCLPNKPQGIADEFVDMSICTIWNSLCLGANEIQGNVFNDLDADGSRDAGELGLPSANVVVEPGHVITSAANMGDYSAWVNAGSFTVQALPDLYQTTTGPAQTATFIGVGEQDLGNNVGLHLIPNVQDLRANIVMGVARPGFENSVWLTWRNVGTMDVDATITFIFDPAQTLVSAEPTPLSINGNTLQWSVTSLVGQVEGSIHVEFYTPVSVPLGTELNMQLVADPVATDETPENNTDVHVSAVVGSCDPNDKLVEPATATTAELALGKKLGYTIRFQNTGTYLAEDVLITDELSELLDPTTFEFTGSSDPCQWYITNGQLQVFFDQIMLPDSNANEPESHGFVSFRIAPVSGLLNGATVENSASIIFDFNAPIITEPAVFTVQDQTGMAEERMEALGVYPNPVATTLWLIIPEGQGIFRAEVLDLSGRVILDRRLATQRASIDVSDLPAGLYHLRVSGPQRSSVARFMKQ